MRVEDEELNFSNGSSIRLLAPGQSTILAVWMTITNDLLNYASVTANPSTSTGVDLVGYEDVSDVDPSEVAMISHGADIDVQNTGKFHVRHSSGLTIYTSVHWSRRRDLLWNRESQGAGDWICWHRSDLLFRSDKYGRNSFEERGFG